MDWLQSLYIEWGTLDSAIKLEFIAAVSQAVAALFSLTALLLSLWVFSRQQRLNRWQLRLHREDHIIAWSQSCIALMAEVEEHLKAMGGGPLQSVPNDKFVKIRAQLSALIDEGRLYFPNAYGTLQHGEAKQEAYQGHRQEILDHLVSAYDFVGKVQRFTGATNTGEIAKRFNEIRRAFVSEAQIAVDPRLFNQIRA